MNYTKAADALHITQPAVTQHIQYLENFYDTKLFIHEGKKILLSHSGEVLLHAATVYQNDQNFVKELMNCKKAENVSIKFGVTMTIGEFVMTKPLSRYIKAHPDSNVQMLISNTSDLLKRLTDGNINFAIVEGYFDSENFSYMLHSTQDFIPVCSAKHQFSQPVHSIRDLFNEHLIVRENGSGTRDILEKHLDAQNMGINNFKHLIEISGMHTIINLLKDDCGITFLYKPAVEELLNNNVLQEIKLDDFNIKHDFTFIWNKGSIYEEDYQKIFKELI